MYSFKILTIRKRKIAELTANITAHDILTAPHPKLMLRDLELKLHKECEANRYNPPPIVTIESQCRFDGGLDVRMWGYLGNRKKICKLVKQR